MHYKLVITLLILNCFLAIPFVQSLEEDDSCNYTSETPGICKKAYECAQAIEDYKVDKKPVVCKDGLVQIVCCPNSVVSSAAYQPPSVTTRTTTITSIPSSATQAGSAESRLIDQKCQEYSKYVYVNGSTSNGNTCAVVNRPLMASGGGLTRSKEFPHMARIGFQCSSASIIWYCEGSVISRRYILTTVYCTKAKKIRVRVGVVSYNLDTKENENAQTIQVESVLIHPLYTRHQYNDIALLKLTHDIEFNGYVRPACINTDNQAAFDKAIVTGWRKSNFFEEDPRSLQKFILERLPIMQCTTKYSTTFILSYGLIEKEQLCYGTTSTYRADCYGDSGGPLQVYHDSYCMYKIIGLSAFGRVCAVSGYPDVYTRVSNYVDWIEDNAFTHG